MQYRARRISGACVSLCVVLCLAALFYSTTHFITRVHAQRASTTGSMSSSPSSGPAGATISVNGSGWHEPAGEHVSLGYMIAAFCSTVSNSQASTFKSGSFSGSLRLPSGTPVGNYSICAKFGSTTAIANTYTVLTESSPHISIFLPTQSGEQQATITGSNYLPSGTAVKLYWETTNGNVILTIGSVNSNSSGLISRTFLIPTSIASGSYKIVANVSGQPVPTSSATFTYNAPSPTPSPTALPASGPTATKNVSPTVVATTAISTPALGVTSLVGSQITNIGQTPSSGTPTSNHSKTNQLTSIVLIGIIIGILAILAIILIIVLFIRRKKARAEQIAAAVGSTQNNQKSWQNSQLGDLPFPINNGSIADSPLWPSTSSPPQQLQTSPYAHLLHQDEGGSSVLTGEPILLAPDDPSLESIKQQVQIGLFATSANHRDD